MMRSISLAITLPLLTALALAAPVPKEGKTPVISAANAKDVKSTLEVAKTVNRILRGP